MKKGTPRLPLLNNYIEKYAAETPNKIAIIQFESQQIYTYKRMATLIDYFALRLLDMGIKKGDRVATQLVLFAEHMALAYACFKIGAIYAPLDLRLKKEEIERDLKKIEPKMFFTHGKTDRIDFKEIAQYVVDHCPYVEHVVQIIPDSKPEDYANGAISVAQMMTKPKLLWLKIKNKFTKQLEKAYAQIDKRTPAIIIYTTGTTGEPKPALLCHENVLTQNEVLYRGVDLQDDDMMLVNLPPSHVGCLTASVMTTIYNGNTAVYLKIFDVELTLKAIEQHKVRVFGQIPTQYRMLWADPNYDKYDLSSIRYALYAGSAADREFLKKLKTMAPSFGTGIGMSESAGFVTFTPIGISVDEMTGQVGRFFDDLAVVTIREPMKADGSAGDIVPDGEPGEICYAPPIVFLGYFNNEEATRRAVSTEGILYTGDLGYQKDMGTYRALFLTGRAKFVIKQKGYNVFPLEVENYILSHPKVAEASIIGMKHNLISEGIFVFVKPEVGVDLDPTEITDYCKNIASYKRPQHVELWDANELFPLTRSAKIDRLALMDVAKGLIAELRKKGKWDA